MGSDRQFGLVFFGFCVLVGAYRLWHAKPGAWVWLIAAGLFLLFAALFPRALRPLNVVWFKFGLLLHAIVSPVVLGLMFFAVFTPLGMLMRIFGKRPLHLNLDKTADSYWIVRKPPGPPPGSFRNQF
jgi:hypothetical protein